jgi:transcriptional antiterminator RfaH
MHTADSWYLIRTKSNREHFVRERLSRMIPEVFVPMLKLPPTRSYRTHPSLVPLFPQYVFARFSISAHYFDICYMPGVAGFVCTGREPVAVAEAIIDSVRSRCTNEIFHLKPRPFLRGDQVRVVQGLFSDFEAIFEAYLSGSRRVAILIETIGGTGLRVVSL